MNPQEIAAYLHTPYIAVVATISRNGAPQLIPNGYRYDGRVLTLITRTDRLKYLNSQRNHRISMCIDDPPVASNDIVISGTATCNEQDIWDEPRPIIARYRAPTEVDDYLAHWNTEPRVLVTVTSFQYPRLAEIRAYAPELPTGWLVSEVSDAAIAQAHTLGLTQICPRADAVTPALVHRLHAEGFVVRAWGMADEALMRRVVNAAADGMTVNFPDTLLTYLQSVSREA